MSSIHLLSLLAAAFLAGQVSSANEQDLIPIDSEYQVNEQYFYDDSIFQSYRSILTIKHYIAKKQEYFKNGMEPSLILNVTGMTYLKGFHSTTTIAPFIKNPETADIGSDSFQLLTQAIGGYAPINSICHRVPTARTSSAGVTTIDAWSITAMSHELGHNLGLIHDNQYPASAPCKKNEINNGTGFIMEADGSKNKENRFSLCSKQLFQTRIRQQLSNRGYYCLNPGKCSNCYKKGTVGNNSEGCSDETNTCECNTGYAGTKCNKCDDNTVNRGTEANPICDTYKTNVSISGYVTRTHNRVTSKDKCLQLCTNNKKCDFSSYSLDKQKCILHSYSKGARKWIGVISGLKYCDPNARDKCIIKGVRYRGPLINVVTNQKSYRKCQYLCRKHGDRCDRFVWFTRALVSSQRCELVSFKKRIKKAIGFVLTPKTIKMTPGADVIEDPPKKDERKCYVKGSMSPDHQDKGKKACRCKPGFTGKLCNKCMPFHKNNGTEEKPDCECFVNNMRHRGSLISNVPGVVSVDNCQKMCNETPACLHFTYLGTDCNLMGDFENRKIDPEYVSGLKFCKGGKVNCHIPGLLWTGINYIDGDEFNIQSNADMCELSCVLEPWCGRWSWSKKGPCFLMRMGLYFRRQPGAISGPPRCEGKPLDLPAPTNADGCYEKGSKRIAALYNDQNICICQQGYYGKQCNFCWPVGVRNVGDHSNPDCKCQMKDYTFSSKYLLSTLGRIASGDICRLRCQELEGCSAYTFWAGKYKCIMFGGVEVKKDTKGMVGGKKFCDGKTEEECYEKGPKWVNLPIVDVAKEHSAKRCHMSCMRNTVCVQWVWNSKNGLNECTLQGPVEMNPVKSIGKVSASKDCPIERDCYAEGSVTKKPFRGRGVEACQCKPGYTGKYCDVCDVYVVNSGTQSEPICGCNKVGLVSQLSDAGFKRNIQTAELCRAECKKRERCVRFTHSPSYKYCYMQGYYTKREFEPNFASGPKFCTVDKSKCIEEGVKLVNLPVIRKGEDNIVNSFEECQVTCIRDPACKTWTWNGNLELNNEGVIVPNGECTLMNIGYQGTHYWAAIGSSGPKTCEAGNPFVTTEEEKCNPEGSEESDYKDKDAKVCGCKDGYIGQFCWQCNPYNYPQNPSISTCSCLIKNAIITGYTLDTKPNRSLQQCQASCKNHDKCHAYSYKTRGRICYRKTVNVKAGVDTTGMVGGKKFCNETNPKDCYEDSPKWLDLPIVLKGELNIQVGEKNCQTSCAKHPYCGGWILNKNSGLNHCTLQAPITVAAKRKGGFSTGRKGCEAPQ